MSRRRPMTSSTPTGRISARSPSPTPRSPGSGVGSSRTDSSKRPSSSSPATTARAWASTKSSPTASSSTRSAIHVPLIVVTPFPRLQGVVSPEVDHAGRRPADRLRHGRPARSRPRSRGRASSRPSSAGDGRKPRWPIAKPIIRASTTAGPTSRASRTPATSSSWPPCPSSTTSSPIPARRRTLSTSRRGSTRG